MNTKLIPTKDYLLLIDTDALKNYIESLSDEYKLTIAYRQQEVSMFIGFAVAHLPLNNAPVLEGVPPMISFERGITITGTKQEEDVELLAKNYAHQYGDVPESIYIDRKQGFVAGYRAKAAIQKQWTDVWQQYVKYRNMENDEYLKPLIEDFPNFLKSLSTVTSLPVDFEPEYEVDPTNKANWYEDVPSGKYSYDEPVPPSADRLYTNGTKRLKLNDAGEVMGKWIFKK